MPASLAPVLGARRDGSASVDTASGLLMTLMGEFMLPLGGTAWTQTIIGLAERLGVRDKAARQALARTCDRGWLDRERVGRQTRWILTDHATELLEPGAERIYGFGQDRRPWDGSWLMLLASVPERDRNVRYRMGLGLSWAGFGSIGQGIWLSPWVDRESVAVEVLRDLGVEATSFHGSLGQLGDAPDLAGRAWDLPELRGHYERFLDDTDALTGRLPDGGDAAAELAALVHRWRRFPFLDPDLPDALLPDDWPGPVAARRFADLRASLLAGARTWWTEHESALDPRRAAS
ncbi:MAG: PaaX family transcriptional regulator C-terminal domain-containing protein [Actinomycetota bacterium]|nr:PaaX family transcriptional regulator C-terminal domain-containing protein [Actinomycetota bacterium]